MMVRLSNVIQVIIDNALVSIEIVILVEQIFPHIFWTSCIVHNLYLTLKNICAAKNTKTNAITYNECHWIIMITRDAVLNF